MVPRIRGEIFEKPGLLLLLLLVASFDVDGCARQQDFAGKCQVVNPSTLPEREPHCTKGFSQCLAVMLTPGEKTRIRKRL